MRAIVCSGGGNKGAFQCGALQYLLSEQNRQYDILCGASVGAINCAFIAQYPNECMKSAAQDLLEMWSKIRTKNIYKKWYPFGFLHSLWDTSIYDSSPLHSLIKDNISLEKIKNNKKMVSVGAVNINSGKYTIFDQSSPFFIEAVIGSASFPGLLTPIQFDGHLWADSGIKQITPIKTAIDMGATEIDIITTSPEVRIKCFIENPKMIDIMKRALDLSSDKIMSNDIEMALLYNRLAEFNATDKKPIQINIIRPDHNLTDDLLDFDPIKIQEMIKLGFDKAKEKFGDNKV